MWTLPDDVVDEIVSKTISISNKKNAKEFGAQVRKLTGINRAFRRVVEKNRYASCHVYLSLGTLLLDPIDCLNKRKASVVGATVQGSTQDFETFLEDIRDFTNLRDLHLFHVPLLDFSLETPLTVSSWPFNIRKLTLLGDERGGFIMPAALPELLEKLMITGGQGKWPAHLKFPLLLQDLEFLNSNITASPKITANFPRTLQHLTLDLQCPYLSIVELASTAPLLKTLRLLSRCKGISDINEGLRMLQFLEKLELATENKNTIVDVAYNPKLTFVKITGPACGLLVGSQYFGALDLYDGANIGWMTGCEPHFHSLTMNESNWPCLAKQSWISVQCAAIALAPMMQLPKFKLERGIPLRLTVILKEGITCRELRALRMFENRVVQVSLSFDETSDIAAETLLHDVQKMFPCAVVHFL